MELEPVLQFFVCRLTSGHTSDVILLQSLIDAATGERAISNHALSKAQIEACATGREMQREAAYPTRLTIKRFASPRDTHSDSLEQTSRRFVAALQRSTLEVPLWIALAQATQGAFENDTVSTMPVKAMMALQDKVDHTQADSHKT